MNPIFEPQVYSLRELKDMKVRMLLKGIGTQTHKPYSLICQLIGMMEQPMTAASPKTGKWPRYNRRRDDALKDTALASVLAERDDLREALDSVARCEVVIENPKVMGVEVQKQIDLVIQGYREIAKKALANEGIL